MRPRLAEYNTTVEAPTWLDALRQQLDAGGKDAPPEILGPATALDELRAVATNTLQGSGPPNSDDLASLRQDVQAAFEEVGADTLSALAPVLTEFRRDVGRLPSLLGTANGARVALAAAHALEQRLVDRSVAGALWDDMTSTFEDGDDAERCELRILQLREVSERRGHNWSQLSRRVVGVINDWTWNLTEAGADVTAAQSPLDEAGLDEAERLRLAREAVLAPAPDDEVIVWLAFEHAWLGQFHQRLGPVEFFAGQLWPEGVRTGNYRDAQPRIEFEGERQEVDQGPYQPDFYGLPDKDFVLARVELGFRQLAGAEEQATRLVTDVVRAARLNSEWRLMRGSALYSKRSGWNGISSFQSEKAVPPDPPRVEPTDHALRRLDQRLVAALSQETPAAQDAADYLRWQEAIRHISAPAQRLVLMVRALERALPTDRDNADIRAWPQSAQRYLKDVWCAERLGDWLVDTTLAAVEAIRADERAAGATELSDIQDQLLVHGGRMMTIHHDILLERAVELAEGLTQGSMAQRLVGETVRRTAAGPDTVAWLDAFGKRFDRLIARAERQRNAAVHGATTIPAVLDTVESFVARLSGRIVAEKLEDAACGVSALDAMEDARYAALERKDRMSKGETAREALFESNPEGA